MTVAVSKAVEQHRKSHIALNRNTSASLPQLAKADWTVSFHPKGKIAPGKMIQVICTGKDRRGGRDFDKALEIVSSCC